MKTKSTSVNNKNKRIDNDDGELFEEYEDKKAFSFEILLK